MGFLNIYLLVGGVVLGLMILLWLLSLALRNASIVDIFWGTGFVIVAWATFALTPEGYLPRKLLLAGLVTVWGLRLSLHILRRNWGKPEDFRYAKWRQENGARWWWRSFFKVFLLQGFLLWIISTPLVAAQASPVPASLGLLDGLAVSCGALGSSSKPSATGSWIASRPIPPTGAGCSPPAFGTTPAIPTTLGTRRSGGATS